MSVCHLNDTVLLRLTSSKNTSSSIWSHSPAKVFCTGSNNFLALRMLQEVTVTVPCHFLRNQEGHSTFITSFEHTANFKTKIESLAS